MTDSSWPAALLARPLAFAAALAIAASTAGCSAIEPSLGPLANGDDGGTAISETTGGGGNAGLIDFGRDIRPLMNRSNTDPTGHGCKECHYPGEGTQGGLMLGKLDLSTLGALRKGGVTSGAGIIDVANPAMSAIVQKLRGEYFEGDRMPKDGPPYWSDADIQKMVTWISQGALGADSE